MASAGCSEPPPPKSKTDATPRASADAQLPPVEVAPDNGFGTNITWRSFDDGLAEAERTGRPLMMVVHTSWCSRCKALKPQFSQADVTRLSERFVMVNIDQDTDERVMQYGPDGTYIPRVMFFDAAGELDASIDNDRSPKFKYFYTSSIDLVKSMHEALERHGKPT